MMNSLQVDFITNNFILSFGIAIRQRHFLKKNHEFLECFSELLPSFYLKNETFGNITIHLQSYHQENSQLLLFSVAAL